MPNDANYRCKCPRCTIRSLRGPAVIITVGILFLLSEMRGNYYLSFHNTWPVILLVLGAISLASAIAPMDGHVDNPVNQVPVNNPNFPPPPPAPPTPPGTLPGQGR